jgi:dihydroorotate dehydrogenase (fumarate)
MDLTTHYLGFKLSSPLMPGSSPIVMDLDEVKKLEDCGAAAIVMNSLFEEQISGERLASIYHMEMYADSYAEALSYFPKPDEYRIGPDQYLEQIRKIKKTVAIPVIGSLNGTTVGGWTDYAKLIQQAGADALELNVYTLATDPQETGDQLEKRTIEVVRAVTQAVSIPVSIKLSPYYSSLANFAHQLDDLGIDGLVLFNRFYQPDIDIEKLEALSTLKLSTEAELLLRLRWLAILSRKLGANLACSGGVHTPDDVIKSVMAGAHAVQLVSCLLEHGVEYLKDLKKGVEQRLEQLEYSSIQQMRGNMSLARCPDPGAFERANYMRILQTWKPEDLGSPASRTK